MSRDKKQQEQKPDGPRGASDDLRKRAEKKAHPLLNQDPSGLSPEEARQLIHELRVHQIELELQNEELRNAQQALDAARSRYFTLYDLAPVAYLSLSAHNLILEANLPATRLLEVPRDKLLKQPLTRFIAPEDQDIYYGLRKRLFSERTAQSCELRLRQSKGPSLLANLQATIDGDGEGDEFGFRVTLTDITTARRRQVDLARTDSLANMGLMAAGVAHEINNPLTYLLYHAGCLTEALPKLKRAVARCIHASMTEGNSASFFDRLGPDAEPLLPTSLDELCSSAKQVEEGAQRIKEISGRLRYFSRVDEQEPGPADLNRAIDQALRMSAKETGSRAMLKTDLGRIPMLMASEGKLAQIFLNLLINAAHSIETGAIQDNRISVRTWAKDDFVFAEVADTGCGIPVQLLDKVFDPFFSTKRRGRGTGLGLAISKSLVEELGGQVELKSEEGRGTCFTLRFPRPSLSDRTIPHRRFSGRKDTPQEPGRVLVVDDDEGVRQTLAKLLSRHHEIIIVGSGLEAKELLAKDSGFDLIVCDMMMPGFSGGDLHRWLQSVHPLLAEEMIFITGGAYTPEAADYLAQTANPQIEKPFDPMELLQIVDDRIRAKRIAADT